MLSAFVFVRLNTSEVSVSGAGPNWSDGEREIMRGGKVLH